MKIFSKFSELKGYLESGDFGKVAFVPTMGALHEGHLSLVRLAKEKADFVIVSIFVNPAQFSPGEDYDEYPRDLKADAKMLEEDGRADAVFTPSVEEVYPSGIKLPDFSNLPKIYNVLIGETRPNYFEGVAKIIYRFFDQIHFDIAVFGQKDFQQDLLIKYVVENYFPNKKIIIAPISREDSGLARSSRNGYLTEEEKENATVIYKSLKKAVESYKNGETSVKNIISQVEAKILKNQFANSIQYLSIMDRDTFEDKKEIDKNSIILIAVDFAGVLLIDNMFFE